MYTEEYERRGFPIRDFVLKLILVIIFVFLLAWLLPKFMGPTIHATTNDSEGKGCPTSTCDTSGINALTSQIFIDNLERMKDAAIKYYTDERLPKEVGASDTMTLSDMIGKKIIIALIDKNNKACDVEKSYVKITKTDDEYILKVNLKDSEKEDYILVHLGCYTYCDSYICQKQGSETPVKGSTAVGYYVPIKGSKDHGIYYPPSSTVPVVSNPVCGIKNGKYYGIHGTVVSKSEYTKQCVSIPERHYCVYYNGRFYDNYGNVVAESVYKKACGLDRDEHYCVKYNGKYYDKNGNIVSESAFKKSCGIEDKHYCVKYDGKYYDNNGKVVSESAYKKACGIEDKHYCVKYDGKYYDNNGNVVAESVYKKACGIEDKHYCVKYDGKYYDNNGNVVSETVFKRSCGIEEKHYCVKYDGKYYDKNGNVVSEATYKKSCGIEENHYCVKYDGKYYNKEGKVVSEVNYIISCKEPKCQIINGYYFGKTGKNVNKDTYESECKPKEYLYEYTKTTATKLSEWTPWSNWSKTDCGTSEINCSDANTSCLKKLQILKRKEKIGTYEKTYAKQRKMVVQTGSYTQRACSKYNYVEINKIIYATTTTTTYTQTNTITSTTRTSTGGWTYNGRASYVTPPADTANTHYKFVGADYSYCSETCTTLPNYYYDSYTYTGGLSNTTTTVVQGDPTVTGTTTNTTKAIVPQGYEASCAEYVTKTIPIYGTITVTEKARRTEPLYGDICYQSTKTRTVISQGSTQKKWSSYNDTSLLNNGWSYTGNKKAK